MNVGVYPGLTPRLVIPGLWEREDRSEYELRGGYSQGLDGAELIAAVEAAGLRGRGGAAFPTGVKFRAVAGRAGPRYLVANGEEGEPASGKDRWLLRTRPHLVLDGLFRAALAIGAVKAYVYLSDREAYASVEDALAELDAPPVETETFLVEAGYVAGEETAAVRALNGGPAKPTAKPPRPFEEGVAGCPTLVSNVETLANLPYVSVHGAEVFRKVGYGPASPGTFLLTVSGACERPGIYEVPLGAPLGDTIERLAGFIDEPSGFLMGGFFAGLLGVRGRAMRLDYDELRAHGSGLGCGAITVLGAATCPVSTAADVMSYFSRENAQQCGSCIKGTAAMAGALVSLRDGLADSSTIERLGRWSVTLRGRGACGTLDGAAALAGSLLREFPQEVQFHVAGGPHDADVGHSNLPHDMSHLGVKLPVAALKKERL